MNYWLFKSEPQSFGFGDLLAKPKKTSCWEGVRNYQARNYMKSMKKGDLGFFYHSSVKPNTIAGIVEIVTEAYVDYFAFDIDSKYFDPKATQENPRWFMVDVKALTAINPPIAREELKELDELRSMQLLQQGTRLSVMPVTAPEWKTICKLRKINLN